MNQNSQNFSLDDIRKLLLDDIRKLLSENNQAMQNNIQSMKNDIDIKLSENNKAIENLTYRVDRLASETRARHYDIQNISLNSNGLSLSGHVSSSQAAGRSPRIKMNSFDTLH